LFVARWPHRVGTKIQLSASRRHFARTSPANFREECKQWEGERLSVVLAYFGRLFCVCISTQSWSDAPQVAALASAAGESNV